LKSLLLLERWIPGTIIPPTCPITSCLGIYCNFTPGLVLLESCYHSRSHYRVFPPENVPVRLLWIGFTNAGTVFKKLQHSLLSRGQSYNFTRSTQKDFGSITQENTLALKKNLLHLTKYWKHEPWLYHNCLVVDQRWTKLLCFFQIRGSIPDLLRHRPCRNWS
jgi:hypothetical protein